jgi:type IV secretory pathway VirB2 component (pilin)
MEMLSHRKPLAALAGVTAVLAFAVPVASASAASTTAPIVDPQVCQLLNFAQGPFGPTAFIGGASLAATLAQAGSTVGCAAPAPQPSLLPAFPFLP